MRNGLAIASSSDMGFPKTYQRSSFCQKLRPDPFSSARVNTRNRIEQLVQEDGYIG